MAERAARPYVLVPLRGLGVSNTRSVSIGPENHLADLTPHVRTSLRAGAAVLVAVWLAYVVHALVRPSGADAGITTWMYDGMLLGAAAACLLRAALVEHERRVWLVMGVGLVSWTAGEIYYSVAFSPDADVPIPSPADIGYLGLYPASYLAIAWLLRSRIASFPRSLWLDGVIAGSAVTAVAAAVTFDPITAASVDGDNLAVATNLAYPIADLVLLSLVVTASAFTGWRPGRSWVLLGAGLVALAVSDVAYLLRAAQGTYVEGGLVDAGWPLCALLVAGAAWTPSGQPHSARLTGLRMAAVPTAAALVAIALQAYDHWVRVSTVAAMLSVVTLVGVALRMALSFRANRRLLESAQDKALTDALTGLGNRRRLMTNLVPAAAMGPRSAEVGLLVMLDLDGFKAYNDAFGPF